MLNEEFSNNQTEYDATLVGAGIMSATNALLLNELLPDIRILIIEKLSKSGQESTGALNNAGTGHAANCELNYTPINSKGFIEIDKSLLINNSFEKSLGLWAYLHESGKIDASKFLKFIPHISFVAGQENVEFLQKRFQLMTKYREFEDMEFSSSFKEIASWSPLIIESRNKNQKIAATRVKRGTDINFEALANEYFKYLSKKSNVRIEFLTELINLKRVEKNYWQLDLKQNGTTKSITSSYVFLGAGGKTISLLQKSKIPESKIYGGFPVSGKWLICEKPHLTKRHNSKVYGKADIGSPPMSVPHLDTRWINDKKYLLYGPFAGFTTKFLKKGSYLDLLGSFKKENVFPIFDVGLKNTDLIKYLLTQSLQNHSSRIKDLQKIMPSAIGKDWYLKNAGQRVQIIKKTDQGGILKFGTEVVNSSDGSLFALLGASPGASTAVEIMIEVLGKSCFFKDNKILFKEKINNIITSKDSLIDSDYLKSIKKRNNEILGFHE